MLLSTTCVGSGDEAWRTERRARKLSVAEGAVAIDAELAEIRYDRRRRHCNEDRCCRAAVGVNMRAPMVGARLAVRVLVVVLGACVALQRHVVLMGAAQGVIHMLMNECVRLGELRRMQDGHLAPAEHRYGE